MTTAFATSDFSLNGAASCARPPAAGTWLNVVSHLDPKYGGLSAAVPALGAAVAGAGKFAVSLSAFCVAGEHFSPAAPHVAVHYLPFGRRAWFEDQWNEGAAGQAFRKLVRQSNGLHIHGLWEHSTSLAARTAQAENKPYIISAHGMLERWALSNKRLKKAIYAALFERANLRGAACLHALTEAEAHDYRRFGLSNPVAVIPNGVQLPAAVSPQLFLERFPELQGKRLVLFLSRIHFKKGLDILCQAWAQVSRQWPDAHLVLAGPDFENTRVSVEKLISSLGISPRVTFTGMLGGDLKWSGLSAAECLVLPSYSEGLSVSVLEAMGMGLPVIITRQCNLPEVASHDCGWVIEPETGPLAAALDELLRTPAPRVSEIAANGRQLVARRYSWAGIGERMSAVYEWLHGGARPCDVLPARAASQKSDMSKDPL
jgi:glycosyltransferase involved in cell wall biosynthesis